MKMAMVRVGIDTGSGRMHGPLFRDGSFEFIPIPDGLGLDERTYGTLVGKHGKKHVEYFPSSRRAKMQNQSAHVDPEFETFTYGDPTSPKAGLRHLEPGDMLVFYCGLEGWGFERAPRLYIAAYFEIQAAGLVAQFSDDEIARLFGKNYHVRHPQVFREQKDRLVLIKGSARSRLLQKAELMSEIGKDKAGHPLQILSREKQTIFGNFEGKLRFQRSPTRWVDAEHVERAASFVKSLP